MRWVRAAAATAPLMDLLGAIVVPLLLLYARDQIKLHLMTTGIFMAFLYAMFNAYMPLKRIGQVYQQFQYAQGASTQVFAYLDQQEEVLDQPEKRRMAVFEGVIGLENVSFSYVHEPSADLKRIATAAQHGVA